MVVALAIILAGLYIQIPYYSLGPGPARDVSKLVSVSGQRVYPSNGLFFLTTVSVSTRPLTLFDALAGWLDPAVAVVKRDVVVEPGLTDAQQDEFNSLDMERSKYSAIVAALHAVGIATPPVSGVRVVAVARGFPAEGVLRPGDLILALDAVAVRDVVALIKMLDAKPVGSTFSFKVLRGGQQVSGSLRTIRSPVAGEGGRPVIGAALAPAFHLPVITVDSLNIGGPSAGLAFALTIADVLTPEDLTRGHRIAVTGTIELDGTVGPVGGVAFKVVAAEREGADVFLVPKEELAEAKAAAKKARVIGVGTLQEAIAALRTLDRRAKAA
jgi:PDZ domain-containing protein